MKNSSLMQKLNGYYTNILEVKQLIEYFEYSGLAISGKNSDVKTLLCHVLTGGPTIS